MAQQPTTTRERLQRLARILDSIAAQQVEHPKYNEDMAHAILMGELRKLAEETARAT